MVCPSSSLIVHFRAKIFFCRAKIIYYLAVQYLPVLVDGRTVCATSKKVLATIFGNDMVRRLLVNNEE